MTVPPPEVAQASGLTMADSPGGTSTPSPLHVPAMIELATENPVSPASTSELGPPRIVVWVKEPPAPTMPPKTLSAIVVLVALTMPPLLTAPLPGMVAVLRTTDTASRPRVCTNSVQLHRIAEPIDAEFVSNVERETPGLELTRGETQRPPPSPAAVLPVKLERSMDTVVATASIPPPLPAVAVLSWMSLLSSVKFQPSTWIAPPDSASLSNTSTLRRVTPPDANSPPPAVTPPPPLSATPDMVSVVSGAPA
ncbi:MAG: hypothetical protein ABW328_18830 [Ilumatobacteraceae bacterium]